MKRLYIYLLLLLANVTVFSQRVPHPNIGAPQGLAVNSYTGNLFYGHTDITLRGTAFPVYGSFYYNVAADTLNYGYGHGWSFYYHVFYSQSGNDIVIHRSDAKKDTFRLSGLVYTAPAGVFEKLTKNGSAYVLTLGNGVQYFFSDPAHRKLTRITDPNNNFVQLDYQGGLLATVRNNNNRTLQLTWKNGLLESIHDVAMPAKKYTYSYDSRKDLLGVTNPLGHTISFVSERHRIVNMKDEKGNPVIIEYDKLGKVQTIRSCNSQQDFAFLPAQRKTIVTEVAAAGNIVTTYEFDAKGRLIAVTDGENGKAYFAYDGNNNLVQVTDPQGYVTKLAYDANGNLLTGTDPLNNTVSYTYDQPLNTLTGVKDKRGQSAGYFYDAGGNLTMAQYPGSIVEKYDYHADGKLKTFTNANNKSTGYEYNSDGDLKKINYPIGGLQYDYGGSCCNPSKVTDGNNNYVEMTYDLMNRLKTISDNTGNTISSEYDVAGNLLKETDPNNIYKRYTYDELNRLQSVTLLSAGTWQYVYDGVGNLLKVTDANGQVTSYSYNKSNQLIQETDPGGNSTHFVYDANGKMVQKKMPNGNITSYSYDAIGRLVEKTYAGNSDKYSYDANGNLVSAFNSNIAYTFEYDNLNRLVKKNILTWGKSIHYTYDNAGNRKTMTDPDGGVYVYTYDDNNRLTSVKNPFNITTGFDYDAGGRLIKQTNGNNTFTAYRYDAAGRIDLIENKRNDASVISSFSYTFDKLGNRKTMQDKRGAHAYGYDSSYRLTSVQYANGDDEKFTIDGTGNRKQHTKNSATVAYTYNAADELLTAGSSTFSYDANGNTLQQIDSVQRQYNYDGENRLIKAVLPSAKTVQYLYDPFGEKIIRIDTNGAITKMIYDGDNLLAELNNSNNAVVRYTTARGMDNWLSMNTGGSNYFFHRDGLNSVTELTNSSAQIVNEYSYDVYGNILSQTVGIKNKILYAGRLWDGGIQLYDYRARFYNPVAGRFLTEDIVRLSLLSFNKYNYVNSNPVNYIDPKGTYIVPALLFASTLYAGYKLYNIVDQFGQRFSQTDAHIYRNCNNNLPSPFATPDEDGNLPGWERQSKFKSIYHQPDLQNNGFWGGVYNYLFEDFRYIKYTKLNDDGTSSSEAIWDTKERRWLNTEEEGGPSFNYYDAGISSIGHYIFDMRAHHYNSKYKSCDPPPPPGDDTPPPPDDNDGDGDVDDDDKDGGDDGPTIDIPIIRASDPNEIIGHPGYKADKKWVSVQQTLPYKIFYENDPDFATAPAQRVTVYLPIDARLNPNSLRIGDFGFGKFNFTVPPNTSVYTTRLDVKDSLGVFVDVTAGIDVLNRRAFWVLQSIDPATGLSNTLAADKGFLPVNDSITHAGEGYLNLTLQPVAGTRTGDSIMATAAIIFDTEDTIKTNIWTNAIDGLPPVSKINALPAETDSTFTLTWAGQDDAGGAGVKQYDLYVSRNHQPFTLYKEKLETNTISFTGDPGITYSFFTIATDHTGNREPMKTKGDDTVTIKLGATQVISICRNTEAIFSTLITGQGYTYQWQEDAGTGFKNISNDTLYKGVNTTVLTLAGPSTAYYGYRYRCIVTSNGVSTATAPALLKFTAYWTGAVSTVWEDAANWSCGILPDQNTDVVIQASSNNPVISVNTGCRNLTLDAGTVLTLKKGITLETKGK